MNVCVYQIFLLPALFLPFSVLYLDKNCSVLSRIVDLGSTLPELFRYEDMKVH